MEKALKELLIDEFKESYNIPIICNWLSYMVFYKKIIPYEKSKLIYNPLKKYPLNFLSFEYFEQPNDLVVIEDCSPIIEIEKIKDKRIRKEELLRFVSDSVIILK